MEMVSTLAHEFQHMIHYYQKTTLLLGVGETSQTWLDEMLAETTEDLVATKIEHTGSRGVVHTDGSAGGSGNMLGRYVIFNRNNRATLTDWSEKNPTPEYSKVNAFGAFLTRNYGGAKILHDIMHNAYSDKRAVTDALAKSTNGNGKNKTLGDVISEWGVAVMLSEIISPTDLPTYNTGDFTSDSYGSSTYKLGSINFFNYKDKPKILTTAGKVNPQANYYYKVGTELTGDIDITIKIAADTEATLIVKKSAP